MTALVSIADALTNQETGSNRDATSGITVALLFLSVLLLLVHTHFTLSLFCTLFSVCRAGQWQCTGEKCAVQCRLMGALQVTTFDKKSYTLQGGDCPFTAVEVRTWLCVCVCVVVCLCLHSVYLGFCWQETHGECALWRVGGSKRGRKTRTNGLSKGDISDSTSHHSHHYWYWLVYNRIPHWKKKKKKCWN